MVESKAKRREGCAPLAHGNNLLQLADLTLHAINALNNDNNFTPWSVSTGLSLHDGAANDLLQTAEFQCEDTSKPNIGEKQLSPDRVVVLENLNLCTA